MICQHPQRKFSRGRRRVVHRKAFQTPAKRRKSEATAQKLYARKAVESARIKSVCSEEVESLFRWRAKRAANKKASMSDHGGESKEGGENPNYKMHFFRPLVGTLLHTFGVYQKYVARPGDRGAKVAEGQMRQRGKGKETNIFSLGRKPNVKDSE